MVKIKNAQIYSSKGNMCFQIEYSEGTKVRAVESKGLISKEYFKNGEWVISGKPYIVAKNLKRNAEKIRESVKSFLGN